MNQYFKDRIKSFDGYYSCTGKQNCDLGNILKWISFFVHKNKDIKNNRFKIELGGNYLNLREPFF